MLRKSFVFDNKKTAGPRLYARKLFPWQASKPNMASVDDACDHLRCPSDWPAMFRVFANAASMKIADALIFCGDRGCYMIGQLDIEDTIRDAFQEALRALGSFLLKVSPTIPLLTIQSFFRHFKSSFTSFFRPFISSFSKAMTNAEIDAAQDKLVASFCALDTMLPLYWPTSTRHHLMCGLAKNCKKYIHYISVLTLQSSF